MASTPKSYVGTVAAATVIEAQPVTISGLSLNAAATSVLTLWDNATVATGTILYQKSFAAATILNLTFANPIRAANGIVAQVATATCQFTLDLS